MNLNGNAGQVMLPLLRILASPDQQHRLSRYTHCSHLGRFSLCRDETMQSP